MRNQCQKELLIPEGILSPQQKQIYKLHCQGLSNKEIAGKLNLDQRSVATQLSRIRKKAANLALTYKIEPGAEHAKYPVQQNSTAGELLKKIQDDPGFFKLMFNRYATNEESARENRYRLASTGQDSALLFNARAKQIKTIAASGSCLNRDKAVVKIGKKARYVLREFFQKQKIQPVQTYWDDGSAVYLVTLRDLEKMRQILSSSFDH